MDRETLKGTAKGFEAIVSQFAYEDGGFCEFPLSKAVLTELDRLSEMNSEEKLELFNDRTADLRRMAGDIRDEAQGRRIELPGLGTYHFEFHGRREAGKESQDEDISLRISRVFDPPKNLKSSRTLAILKRISDREAPLIKSPGGRLNLRRRQGLPQIGTFAVLFDTHETVKIMHKTLGLDKEAQVQKSKS
ncbi:MAG TPA: hypothetical protein VFX86_01605 [Candidatus Saccharimonadales bacterium]|nr:hypothetical protein [Candidatus Saccharimonadales bacterium]